MSTLTLVFDTETTGLPLHGKAPLARQPRCIEFGAVLLDAAGEIVEEFNQLIDPGEQIEAVITKITGITNADLAGQPRIADVMPRIRALFAQASTAIAHNLAFDRSIVQFELDRLAMPADEFPWCARMLCTVEATMGEWGRRPKLLELYAATMGRPLTQTHRALDDAKALAEIVVELGLHKP